MPGQNQSFPAETSLNSCSTSFHACPAMQTVSRWPNFRATWADVNDNHRWTNKSVTERGWVGIGEGCRRKRNPFQPLLPLDPGRRLWRFRFHPSTTDEQCLGPQRIYTRAGLWLPGLAVLRCHWLGQAVDCWGGRPTILLPARTCNFINSFWFTHVPQLRNHYNFPITFKTNVFGGVGGHDIRAAWRRGFRFSSCSTHRRCGGLFLTAAGEAW
jgi:hypothetical protein